MSASLVARILGIAFLLAAIAGFVPAITTHAPPDAEVVTLDISYGMMLGLFPVNIAHNVLHLVFGAWGLLASRAFASSVAYCRAVTVVYAIVVIAGIVPITNTLFGTAPIYGHDVWLHAIIALFAAYGGFGAGSIPTEESVDVRA